MSKPLGKLITLIKEEGMQLLSEVGRRRTCLADFKPEKEEAECQAATAETESSREFLGRNSPGFNTLTQ